MKEENQIFKKNIEMLGKGSVCFFRIQDKLGEF